MYIAKVTKNVKHMIKNIGDLSEEESGLFIELFESSLRIYKREHFFSWLQGCFQCLLPHEVLICGVRLENQHELHFESFISTRYVTEHHVELATKSSDGLILRAITSWQENHRPIFIADGMSVKNVGTYIVPFVESERALKEIELKNVAAHGLASKEGNVISFFSFSRVPRELNAKHAYFLELLVPHMHAALVRMLGVQYGKKSISKLGHGKIEIPGITSREQEVLRWVRSGKTNIEIGIILNISTNTVKNHVHSAISKLGVENRLQAATKAYKLGMVNVS